MYDNSFLDVVPLLWSGISHLFQLLFNSPGLYFRDIVGDGGKDAP